MSAGGAAGRTPSAALAKVSVGPGAGTALPNTVQRLLVRTVVETDLNLPGMFELSFQDPTGAALRESGLEIGAQVQVNSGAAPGPGAGRLIVGEVTAIEGDYEEQTGYTVVRGYDALHRLQRVRRTRAFVNMSDDDVAARIAREAGLEAGPIEPTGVVHEHLSQFDQTDWEFLTLRAAEIGYELGMADGRFFFRPASSVEGGESEPYALKLRGNLRSFAPRLTAGNLAPEVEVRVWDPVQMKAVAARSPVSSGAAAGTSGPDEIAELFGAADAEEGAESDEDAEASDAEDEDPEADPGADPEADPERFGPAPSGSAYIVHDLPVGSGPGADPAADQAARSLAGRLGGTFAEARGEADGSPLIQAGSVVAVQSAPSVFPTRWVVTRARHVFDLAEGGYHTEFAATGRLDRSLLALAAGGGARPTPPRVSGVVCAVVTNIGGSAGRVKLTLPWLSPDYESNWAPVVQFGAGGRSGAMFMPEVGDQVLVAFEFGDPRRPYVLGGVVSGKSEYSLVGAAVRKDGAAASVVQRGFVSASGSLLAFLDEVPPGKGARPTRSQIALGTADGTLGFALDAVKGTLMISCAQEGPPGELTVCCGEGGTVNLQAGPGGTVNIDGGDSLTVKSSASLTIESTGGNVSIKGATISLN